MKKLLDLRFVIGAFFTIVGLLLFVYHFAALADNSLNTSVNLTCGVLFILFGLGMLTLSYVQKTGE